MENWQTPQGMQEFYDQRAVVEVVHMPIISGIIDPEKSDLITERVDKLFKEGDLSTSFRYPSGPKDLE